MTAVTDHPVLVAAAEGVLPPWAVAGTGRREHIHRVRRLMGSWAREMGLGPDERARWTAAATLHDALRGARPSFLRDQVPAEFRDLPGSLLHGPAVAERLRSENVDDEGLLLAVTFHSIGHPAFDAAGRALFAADVLEPGRKYRPGWRSRLRGAFPGDPDGVVREVVGFRLERALEEGHPIRRETVGLWNASIGEKPMTGDAT